MGKQRKDKPEASPQSTSGQSSGTETHEKAPSEGGADQVQEAFDEAKEKGFFGETPGDDDPDEYTVQGGGGIKAAQRRAEALREGRSV